MTRPASLTGADAEHLRTAGRILDLVGRRTDNAAVALHAIDAAEHLAARIDITDSSGRSDESGERSSVEDEELLRAALRELSVLSSAALRDDDIAEALHQATFAHLAAR